ncbi:molecular chaperone DnaJ [Candidatus Peribacteria bacterium RIFCSPHIGHO2_02_FULL_52_16]|nr:MAG: molecular chaperone DnaJ [Candidatus Peribacteria bacterium RIFCSPHIGHO2_01_FULL_51_35]OGJ61519.1 MAG: molecular chaperone DnaJ [Candidatus Peribacteria bacterium RIFCSPHIGHO2_02_FULL_52_16]
MAKNYYDVLGIQKNASVDDIKQAYRKMSKELHPDKHKGDKAAEQKFKEVNEAYEILGNAKKKQQYDQFGTTGNGQGGFGGGAGGFDFSGFTEGGNFSDIFESFFGGARGGAQREERGADREMEIAIDLHEVLKGAAKTVRIERNRSCETCGGSGAEKGSALTRCTECGGTGQVERQTQSFFGMIRQRFVCPQCKGSGKVPEKPCKECKGEGRRPIQEDLRIDIPAGIEDGQSLRLRGEGDAGRQGKSAGDLYVHVRVKEDPRFVRDGTDVRTITTISALDAILGTEIDVETLQGSVTLRIPEGTQPAQVFRLKGKGLPLLNSSRMGDHYVTVEIEIPKKLSRAERKLLEEWKKLEK